MVVDDLGDLHLGGAIDGLRQLIVVDQHEAGVHGLEDVGLGEDAQQAALFVDDMAKQGVGLDDAPADDGELVLRAEPRGVVLDEPAEERGGAYRPGRRRAVRTRIRHRNLAAFGEFEDIVTHAVAARHDDEADAHLDGADMDVGAVAHDDDAAVVRDALGGRGLAEGFQFHRRDAHVELVDRPGVEGDHLGAVDGTDDGMDRGPHLAHGGRAARLRDEVVPEAEDRDIALEQSLPADDRQGADIMQVEQLQRPGAGVVDGHLERVATHDVLDAGRDVADEDRQRGAETVEDRVDAGVGIAATGRHETCLAGRLLEGRIREGRADRVGVRILMADDVRRLGGTGRRKRRRDGHETRNDGVLKHR